MKKYWDKFKTIFPGGALMIAGLLVLSACTYSEEEKALIAEYEARGQEYALRYAEEKYGFVPEIVGVDFDTYGSSGVPDPTPPPNGWVYVDMSDGTEEFQVYVNAQEDSDVTQIDACDNYQRDEIREAVKQQINAIVPMEAKEIRVEYRSQFSNSPEGMISQYYDGTNLAAVLEQQDDYNFEALYVDEDLSQIDINEVKETLGSNVVAFFVNYRDEDSYKSHRQLQSERSASQLDYLIEKYAIWVSDYIFINEKGETEVVEFPLYETEDFSYVPMDATYCEIKETTMADASNWNGHGFKNASQIFGAYSIDTDASKVIVYVDKKQIASKMKDDRAMFVTESLTDGESNYRSESTSDFGTVILSQIRIRDKKDIKFSVFTDDRTDE